MGKTNSKTYSKENNKNKSEEEFEIIKNDKVYNIKICLIQKSSYKEIKINISFVFNNEFHRYEGFFGKEDNPEEIYHQIINQLRDDKFELIQQNREEYILLEVNINKNTKGIKLFPILGKVENKYDELIKNFISLEKNYVQLKKEIKGISNLNPIIKKHLRINQDIKRNRLLNIPNLNNYNHNLNENNINVNEQIDNEITDENHIILETGYKIWCMLKLNKISDVENTNKLDLNLVALGCSSKNIIIITLNPLKIYQELKTIDTVYSLTQFKDDSKYLISSLSNGQLIIYLLKGKKYEEFQVLKKPEDLRHGEFNKVITLSDGNLATAERNAISIWKPKIEGGLKKFYFFKEITTGYDTCQLLEVNPEVFACAIYRSKEIRVYKNDGKEFPLLGTIDNVESHGTNSNGMCKIDDNIFCSGGGNCFIYIVSINPVQIIQKLIIHENKNNDILFLHNCNDSFIFTSIDDDTIQYKIIRDEDGNFIKLEKFFVYEKVIYNSSIITTEDGKILYKQKKRNFEDKNKLFLTEYKK